MNDLLCWSHRSVDDMCLVQPKHVASTFLVIHSCIRIPNKRRSDEPQLERELTC